MTRDNVKRNIYCQKIITFFGNLLHYYADKVYSSIRRAVLDQAIYCQNLITFFGNLLHVITLTRTAPALEGRCWSRIQDRCKNT